MNNKRKKTDTKTEHSNLKTILFVLSGSIMIGHGLRMIYQGVFCKGSSYIPGTFDIFFDWLTLAVLGFIILVYGLNIFYHSKTLYHHKKTPNIH